MKRSFELILFILLLALVVFLFSFSKDRNGRRKLTKIDIEFIDENPPFISLNTVNKLLIQNYENVTSIDKETLVLKEMESRLLKNPMISDAKVFVTVDGALGAKIEQRTPVGRVIGSPDYYLDANGTKMPLSSVYTARVPLVNGSSNMDLEEISNLLLKINEDSFMKNGVVGLDVKSDGNIILLFRKHTFKMLFGKANRIEKKFQNFKAFYQKTKQDSSLFDYSLVNLQFESQVVATKR
jgi:cell division protein FtsQ